ncbi:MAG TPA: hypothetical protein VJN92_17940 [Candidatus Acidoferrum sp.]|nr:hypothetical protein [Candidatus Acidoferrum sp.]
MGPRSADPDPREHLLHACRSLATSLVGVALLCFGSALNSFAQTEAQKTESTDTLRGTVVNSVTHQPIARALVHSTDNRFATITDDRGQFHFEFPTKEDLPVGSTGTITSGQTRYEFFGPRPPIQLLAEKPGFLFRENKGLGIFVGSDQQAVTIAMRPEALVVGRIVLPSIDYLDRIQVDLYQREHQQGREHWTPAGTTQSRGDGSFRFAGLAAGDYKLVSHELLDRDPLTFEPQGQLFGYPPVFYPSSSDFAAAETIQLSPGMTFQASISPLRREYYTVKIGVLNAAPFTQVEVWPQGHPGPGYSLSFDSAQNSITGSLPNGTYTIHAATFEPEPMTGTSTLTVAGGPASGGTLVLLPNPSIKVSVTEEFQDPRTSEQIRNLNGLSVPNSKRPNYISVTLQSIEQFGYAPRFSLSPPAGPDDESLVIKSVKPGSYRVQAMTAVGYISSITSGGNDLLHKPLLVAPGSAPPAIEITLRDDGAQVDGKVDFTPRGSLFQSPSIYFVPLGDSTGQFRMAWLTADGGFQLHHLAPGAYRVFAFERPQPDLEFATEETLSQYESKSQMIQVVAGQEEHLHLSLISESE